MSYWFLEDDDKIEEKNIVGSTIIEDFNPLRDDSTPSPPPMNNMESTQPVLVIPELGANEGFQSEISKVPVDFIPKLQDIDKLNQEIKAVMPKSEFCDISNDQVSELLDLILPFGIFESNQYDEHWTYDSLLADLNEQLIVFEDIDFKFAEQENARLVALKESQEKISEKS
eukprot:TRINITY_DN1323_c0_g1_i1.p1 TRINITY_DN1323_c0_g1~~TRINITY_DN1323_c0_g1_i1.p1  ORF type:complete len:193 (+),score=68.74 TRINITY_DN1323_c0_g1_i1:68-580(+)